MSRLLFFIREAFRALRRNARPEHGRDRHHRRHRVLLGVLIPVFQTTQAKSDEVRDSLEFRVAALRRRDQSRNRRAATEAAGASRTSPRSSCISKAEALEELEGRPRQGQERRNCSTQLHANPLPANFAVKADDAANLDSVRQAIIPPGPDGKPQPISPIVQETFDRQQASPNRSSR